jgi:putative membrane protein
MSRPLLAAAPVTVGLLALPATVLAHGGEAPPPSFPSVLLAWSFDPLALALIGGAALVWLRAVREVDAAHPRTPVSPWRTAAFLGGLAAIALALLSPVERYESALISVHMVQHMLLQLVGAPLLLLGAPVTLALRVASPVWRARLLAVLRSRIVHVVTHPIVAWILFVVVTWGWQFSPLYDVAVENTLVHYVQHAIYLGAALLFWWPVIAADPAPRKLSYPVRAAYLAMAIPQSSFLGITLMNVQPSLYPHYWTQLRTWGPPFAQDLQIAGAIMWGNGSMMFGIGLILVVAAWMRAEERQTRRREARPDARRAAEAALAAYREAGTARHDRP